MNGTLELAQLLISSWLLHSNEDRIPASHGLLDRALWEAVDRRALPDWAVQQLHFAESREGLQCIELQRVLDYAQEAGLTHRPNPSYQHEQVALSKPTARRLLRQLGVREDDAKRLGEMLVRTVAETRERDRRGRPSAQSESQREQLQA